MKDKHYPGKDNSLKIWLCWGIDEIQRQIHTTKLEILVREIESSEKCL